MRVSPLAGRARPRNLRTEPASSSGRLRTVAIARHVGQRERRYQPEHRSATAAEAAPDLATVGHLGILLAIAASAEGPWRATAAEAGLRCAPATTSAFRRAADDELATAEPLAGNAIKVALVRNVVTALLVELTGRAVGTAARPDERYGRA
ncbi:MAG TPA: hypothetical protein VIT41_07300 [Microlunatus sp.]